MSRIIYGGSRGLLAVDMRREFCYILSNFPYYTISQIIKELRKNKSGKCPIYFCAVPRIKLRVKIGNKRKTAFRICERGELRHRIGLNFIAF